MIIIGHPTDTAETVHDTINFALRLRDLGATMLSLSVLTPYPGTEVYHEAEKHGIRILSEDWNEYVFSRVVMETKRLSADQLRELYFEGLSLILA